VTTVGDDRIVDDAEQGRFVVVRDGLESELVYRRHGDRLVLVHTGVPDELSGHGIGGQLVDAALAKAREEGLTVVPLCPYARGWLERHPDEASSVQIDWNASPAGA
jgi:predicted GNAT family acetyltransferase